MPKKTAAKTTKKSAKGKASKAAEKPKRKALLERDYVGMRNLAMIIHKNSPRSLTKKKAAGLAKIIIQQFFIDSIVSGKTVRIPGIGSILQSSRAARRGHNPKTNKPIDIPARQTIKLKKSKTIKALMARQNDEPMNERMDLAIERYENAQPDWEELLDFILNGVENTSDTSDDSAEEKPAKKSSKKKSKASKKEEAEEEEVEDDTEEAEEETPKAKKKSSKKSKKKSKPEPEEEAEEADDLDDDFDDDDFE